MSYWEKIYEIMKSDPERKWTAPEIASILKPNAPVYEYYDIRCHVLETLKRASKYGLVKHDGWRKSENHNTTCMVWVLA